MRLSQLRESTSYPAEHGNAQPVRKVRVLLALSPRAAARAPRPASVPLKHAPQPTTLPWTCHPKWWLVGDGLLCFFLLCACGQGWLRPSRRNWHLFTDSPDKPSSMTRQSGKHHATIVSAFYCEPCEPTLRLQCRHLVAVT